MRHPVSTAGFDIPAIPGTAKSGALDSRLRGNDGEESTPGFVIPAKVGIQADGEVSTPGFVIPAKAGIQGFPGTAKSGALDSRLRGIDA
jgi:hypothetical protein